VTAGQTYTWDSDVSKLLPPPPRPGAKTTEPPAPILTVLRGDAEESVTEKNSRKGAQAADNSTANPGSASNSAGNSGDAK
jgi:hypothetical protein